jgi:hypothetical protein
MHDYALHGPTVFESTAAVDFPLTPMPGKQPLLLPSEAAKYNLGEHPYGVFSNVKSGTPNEHFVATYRLVNPYELPPFQKNPRYPHGNSFHHAIDPNNYADRGEIGVRSHFLGLTDTHGSRWQVLLGETPSLLRGGLIGGTLTDKLQRPSLLLRHEGDDTLASVFIAVHEPYYRAPKIVAARSLKTKEQNTVALEIELATRVDTVLLSLDGPSVTVTDPHAAALHGRLAVIERTKGKPSEGWLVGGDSVKQGDLSLTNTTSSYSGTIEAASSVWAGDSENVFVTTAELPEGKLLAGRWMIVHHGTGTADEGYRIASVERRGNKSIIRLTDDPGLKIVGEKTQEIFFPRRRWTGPNRFTVLTQTSTNAPAK